MTTQAQAQTAIDLATKWIDKGIGTMVSSAQVCLDDAKALMTEGKYNLVCAWAKRSLAYSVGIFHPDYKSLEGDRASAFSESWGNEADAAVASAVAAGARVVGDYRGFKTL